VIKAVVQRGNKPPLLILGLSSVNMTRLMADDPIRFNLAELGLPATEVVLVGGDTEEEITVQLVASGLIPQPGKDPGPGHPG
jgi:hypothetical protein